MKAALSLPAALAVLGAALAQDAPQVKSVSPPGPGGADLKVEWKAPFLPDGTTLGIQLTRIEERFKGGALKVEGVSAGGGQGYAKGGAFGWSGPVGGPGSFRAAIELSADYQGARALQALKDGKIPMPQKWTSEFDAWGEDLAGRLGPALGDFGALAAKADALLRKCADASADRQTWRANLQGLESEVRRLMEEVGQSEAKKVFPAASLRLSAGTDIIFAATRCIRFDGGGKPRGFTNFENPQDPILKFEGEVFAWEGHRKRIEGMKETAGREFALWALKDLRRTAGRPGAALLAALRKDAQHPGLAPYAEKLQRGDPPKDLEDSIRGTKK